MTLTVPKAATFDCPEGVFEGFCESAGVIKSKSTGREEFRIRWIIPGPAESDVDYKVGKSFESNLAEGAPLRVLIEGWIDEPLQPGPFDVGILIGRRARLTITHIHFEPYDKPFCSVEKVEPVDNLRKRISQAQGEVPIVSKSRLSIPSIQEEIPAADLNDQELRFWDAVANTIFERKFNGTASIDQAFEYCRELRIAESQEMDSIERSDFDRLVRNLFGENEAVKIWRFAIKRTTTREGESALKVTFALPTSTSFRNCN
jgi:hypothetical protein